MRRRKRRISANGASARGKSVTEFLSFEDDRQRAGNVRRKRKRRNRNGGTNFVKKGRRTRRSSRNTEKLFGPQAPSVSLKFFIQFLSSNGVAAPQGMRSPISGRRTGNVTPI